MAGAQTNTTFVPFHCAKKSKRPHPGTQILSQIPEVSAEERMRKKKCKEDEQTIKELNSAHRCLQAKYQLVQN